MQPNDDQLTAALFSAASDGDLAKATDAIAAGADVNAANAYGVTPLLEATGQGHLTMVRFLVGRGADVNYAGMSEGTPLTLAAFMGLTDILRVFLAAAGTTVNLAVPNGGETALHMAAVAGKTEAARALLEAGADPSLHANSGIETSMFDGGVKLWGETPLHFAAAYGDEEMVREMVAAGSDRRAANAHGETPLEYAGRHKRPRGILRLLT